MVKKSTVLGEISINKIDIQSKSKAELKKVFKEKTKPNQNVSRVSRVQSKIPSNEYLKSEAKEKDNTTAPCSFGKKIIPIYIGNINKNITENILSEEFSKYPSLVSVKICRKKISGESLGYGYLNFTSQLDIQKVFNEYNYSIVFGQEIKLMPSLRNNHYRKILGTNVFFSNLPTEAPEFTTRKFYDIFRQYGNILSCKLEKEKNIGFIYFEDHNIAAHIIKKFNHSELYGKEIVCGLHFDKELRGHPGFEEQKERIDKRLILEDELSALNGNNLRLKNKSSYVNSIFVKNLPLTMSKEEIIEHFSKTGPIKSIFISEKTKHNSKWAFITYKLIKDVNNAVQKFNDTTLQGKIIKVSRRKQKKGTIPIDTNVSVLIEHIFSNSSLAIIDMLFKEAKIDPISRKLIERESISGTFSGRFIFQTNEKAIRAVTLVNNRSISGQNIKASLEGKSITKNLLESFQLRKGKKNSELENNSELYSDWKETKIPQISSTIKAIQLTHTIKILERQIKKVAKFSRYLFSIENIDMILMSKFIIEIFWYNDLNILEKFLTKLHTHISYEEILHRQIETSVRILGYL